MKTITKQYEAYEFSELSDSAKDNVRSWFAETLDYEWWDFTLDDFVSKMDELGIEIDKERGKKNSYMIHFSGFYSQGDGASFTAGMNVEKFLKSHKATKEYWLLYTNIIRDNIDLAAYVKENGRYFSMIGDYDLNFYADVTDEKYNKIEKMAGKLAEFFLEKCRDYASDLYRDLENECDYLLSDESIVESCEANEYLFDSRGNIL